MKRSFFQAAVESMYGCTKWTLTNCMPKKTWRQLHKNAASNIDQVLETAPNKTRVQILDETDCFSHSTNTLGEGMNPIILPPAMGE